MLLGGGPQRSCRPCRHFVIALRVGRWRSPWVPVAAPVGIDVGGHWRQEELGADVELGAPVVVHHQIPVGRWPSVGLSWAQVVAGDGGVGRGGPGNGNEQLPGAAPWFEPWRAGAI